MICADSQVLFQAGTEGYHTFRIPALVRAQQGTLLAFAEARRYTPSDTGEIAIVFRRSDDNGVSFGPMRTVVAVPDMTCGNPAPVFDETTGIVWLLFCMNPKDGPERLVFEGRAQRTVWVMSSDDKGDSWSAPFELTGSVKPDDWTWYATGPGHGIQLANGRLVVPCDHAQAKSRTHADPVRSHVVTSDDHGRTWQLGGIVSEACSSECGLVETEPNQVLLEFRHDTDRRMRGLARSLDGGSSFGPAEFVTDPPDPGCRGGVVGLGPNPHAAELLFVSHVAHREQRENLVLRVSRDGRQWELAGCLWPGPAAYSELLVAADGTLCSFFEAGASHPYQELRFGRITWEQ